MEMDRTDVAADGSHGLVVVVECTVYMIRAHRRYDLLGRNKLQHDLQLGTKLRGRKHVRTD